MRSSRPSILAWASATASGLFGGGAVAFGVSTAYLLATGEASTLRGAWHLMTTVERSFTEVGFLFLIPFFVGIAAGVTVWRHLALRYSLFTKGDIRKLVPTRRDIEGPPSWPDV